MIAVLVITLLYMHVYPQYVLLVVLNFSFYFYRMRIFVFLLYFCLIMTHCSMCLHEFHCQWAEEISM